MPFSIIDGGIGLAINMPPELEADLNRWGGAAPGGTDLGTGGPGQGASNGAAAAGVRARPRRAQPAGAQPDARGHAAQPVLAASWRCVAWPWSS